MPRYKYGSAHAWLEEKITAEVAAGDVDKLADIAKALAGEVDADDIQDLYQGEMDADGFFDDLDATGDLPGVHHDRA